MKIIIKPKGTEVQRSYAGNFRIDIEKEDGVMWVPELLYRLLAENGLIRRKGILQRFLCLFSLDTEGYIASADEVIQWLRDNENAVLGGLYWTSVEYQNAVEKLPSL